jgi:hypothetical protein
MYQPGEEKGDWAEAKQRSHAGERRRIGDVPLTSHHLLTTSGTAEMEYDRTRLERIRVQVRDDLRRANEAASIKLSLRGFVTMPLLCHLMLSFLSASINQSINVYCDWSMLIVTVVIQVPSNYQLMKEFADRMRSHCKHCHD